MKAHGSYPELAWVLALIYGTPMGLRWAFDGFVVFRVSHAAMRLSMRVDSAGSWDSRGAPMRLLPA